VGCASRIGLVLPERDDRSARVSVTRRSVSSNNGPSAEKVDARPLYVGRGTREESIGLCLLGCWSAAAGKVCSKSPARSTRGVAERDRGR
jgi:hypothetical protein